MTAFCHFGHGIFCSGQPEVHLSRFRESGVLGMTAELCCAVPMVLSRCNDAHAQLPSCREGNATAQKRLQPYAYIQWRSPDPYGAFFSLYISRFSECGNGRSSPKTRS